MNKNKKDMKICTFARWLALILCLWLALCFVLSRNIINQFNLKSKLIFFSETHLGLNICMALNTYYAILLPQTKSY